jgi:hypothetical protein
VIESRADVFASADGARKDLYLATPCPLALQDKGASTP